jgi:DNA polymerase-3 subunit delta'
MDYNWKLAGHKKQADFFSKAIKRTKLAHAYIFAGPSGIGKKTFAKNLAQILLCQNNNACNACAACSALVRLNNADFLELNGRESIKIEQVRALLYKLSLKPYMSQYKVAVIDHAENMTAEAASALLKNLEEPKPDTVIVLITATPDRLLRTISSRSQKINFGPVAFSEYESFLPENLSDEQKKLIADFAPIQPGIAFKIASEPDFMELLSETKEQYGRFVNTDAVSKLQLAYELADLESAQIKEALDFWLWRLERELKAGRLDYAPKIRSLISTRKLLDHNVNVKLLLTNLMLAA